MIAAPAPPKLYDSSFIRFRDPNLLADYLEALDVSEDYGEYVLPHKQLSPRVTITTPVATFAAEKDIASAVYSAPVSPGSYYWRMTTPAMQPTVLSAPVFPEIMTAHIPECTPEFRGPYDASFTRFRDPNLLADYLEALDVSEDYGGYGLPHKQLSPRATHITTPVVTSSVKERIGPANQPAMCTPPVYKNPVAVFGAASRSLGIMFEIILAWRSVYNTERFALRVLSSNTTLTLANKYLLLTKRIKRLDVTAFSSNVISARIDLMKYVVPTKPASTCLHRIQDCMRGWICKVRLRKHRQGVRSYPVHRIRCSKVPSVLSGITWVNPKNMKQFGRHLAIGGPKRRISNAPSNSRGRPTDADWVHCYLTGQYIRGNYGTSTGTRFEENYPKSHKRASAKYRKHLSEENWYELTKTAWAFEFNTYGTEQFYHDYHMGDMYDSQRNCLSLATRATRLVSEGYRKRYVANIDYLDGIMARRNG